MSIREQQTEAETQIDPELDTASAATDSALRQLDVAEGPREAPDASRWSKLEERLLEKEKELTGLQRELRARSEIGGRDPAHAELAGDEAASRRQATARALVTTTLCFVGARRGNAFMNELLAAVAHEVEAAGMPTELAFDALPEDSSYVYVLIPHEYYECVREELHPTRAQLGRTIAFCTEQPGTHWFDLTRAHAASAGAAVDIYPDAVRALARAGCRRRALPARLQRLLGSLGSGRER